MYFFLCKTKLEKLVYKYVSTILMEKNKFIIGCYSLGWYCIGNLS